MPIYLYRCENCGMQLEKQQKFSDQPLTRCPECGKKALKKIYQPVGIVFKGSGFYATDHHSPSGQSPAKSDEKKDKPERKSETGTEPGKGKDPVKAAGKETPAS